MTYTYTFKNQSSPDNIPMESKRILKDTINMYMKVIPKDALVCIFIKGSITRGNFKPGVSDFDTDAIVRRELTKKEQVLLKEQRSLLEDSYKKMGIIKIDIGTIDIQHLLTNEKPELSFILTTDGVCIYGEAPALKRTWPDPGNELSKILNRDFPKKIKLYQDHLNCVSIARTGLNVEQWLAKEGVRLLFGMTMQQSKEYTAKIEDYREYVKVYLNEKLTCFDHLYAVYLGERIQGDKLLTLCEQVLKLARRRGAI